MKKIVVSILITLFCLVSFSCKAQEVQSYTEHEGVPDFGAFMTEAELDQVESDSWTSTIGGTGAPYIYIYYVPTEYEDNITSYDSILVNAGFDNVDDHEIERGETLYENKETGEKVKVAYGDDKNAPEGTLMVQIWIF